MEESGIVRRVDELGRIVIPKEIRKAFRIYEGSLLSVGVSNGQIVLSKYSKVGSLKEYAMSICEVLSNMLDCSVFVCDLENVIASTKKSINGKSITESLINNLLNKKCYILQKNESMMLSFYKEDVSTYVSQGILPIITEGDVIGGIVLYSVTEKYLTLEDLKVAQALAKLMGEL